MSKVTRIVLAALLSLAVIVGIYTSVQGASLGALQDRTGAHQVTSSKLINLDRFRSPETAPAVFQSQNQPGKGHGCGSDFQTSPED